MSKFSKELKKKNQYIEEMKMIIKKLTIPIQWDRYIEIKSDKEIIFKLFGWIPRQTNKKDDFILIRFYKSKKIENDHILGFEFFEFTTSSAKYSNQISKEFGIKDNHTPCQKWEY